jgi:MSHA pilin protein MshD
MSPITPDPTLERGVTLVELIIFIVIISSAVAGVLMTLDIAGRSSADPMIQKQALAIAEALLEEIQLQPFTFCDPDDSQAATAQTATEGATGCSVGGVEAIGREMNPPYGPETRTSATTPFDNVNDYDGFCMGPGCAAPSTITDLNGTSITGLEAYTATVAVTTQGVAPVPASDSLLITVTVQGPANTTVVLHGYRVRYAPNALP